MSLPARRAELTILIAQQRGDLGVAYRGMAQPFHYAELGMRGFGFIKQFPWLFVAGPTMLSAVFSSLGFLLRRGQPARITKQEERALAAAGLRQPRTGVMLWVGRGLKLAQLLFKLRRFFL